MGLRIVVVAVSLFSFLHAGTLRRVPPAGTLAGFIARTEAIADTGERRKAAAAFMEEVRQSGGPLTEDSTVSFVFEGRASRVSVASDLNGWNPRADTLKRLRGTEFFYVSLRAEPAARFEYKLIVDSTWILDPVNSRQAMGGYGPNSEVTMPLYRPPQEIIARTGVPRGTLDTLLFRSTLLGRAHPLIVYLPPRYASTGAPHPVLFVLDGGEYLGLGLMNVVLDNLIADDAIEPPVCVFLDPRTNPGNPQTSTRMKDYTMSDSFVAALVTEIRPFLLQKYRITGEAARTGIMGASLGGLAALHASFERPDVFGLCAAQSGALWWQESRLLRRIEQEPVKPFRVYLDTGTMRDAQDESRRARAILTARGYQLHYEEHPEGHNWFNWRARIGSILRYFWGNR